MTMFGRPPGGIPGRIARRLARHPIAVISVASLGVRMGKDAFKVKKGEIDPKEWRLRAGTHLGSITGGIAGAAAGAIALSAIPGVGPLLGGFAGGMAGEMGGGKIGRRAVEAIEDRMGDLFGTGAAQATAEESEGNDGEAPHRPPSA